jgi:flagellar protein FliJ
MATKGFRLGQVLELKRRLEDEKQLELRALLAEEHAIRAAIQDLRQQIEVHVAAMGERARGGAVDAADLEAGVLFLERLEATVEERHADLEASAERVAACRAELVTALQERRALEMLQARQEAEARREADRREAREVDDLVAARYALDQSRQIEKGASV